MVSLFASVVAGSTCVCVLHVSGNRAAADPAVERLDVAELRQQDPVKAMMEMKVSLLSGFEVFWD